MSDLLRDLIAAAPTKRRRSKYGSVRVQHPDTGAWFDSKSELKRYMELELLQRAGEIRQLARQVCFPLDVNGQHVATMRLDYEYLERGRRVVEDRKGAAPTPDWKLKAKLFQILYPDIELRITR